MNNYGQPVSKTLLLSSAPPPPSPPILEPCMHALVPVFQILSGCISSLSGYPFSGLQARSKDQEILEEGGGAGPSLLPRRDHE